jgi:hypothetical protein
MDVGKGAEIEPEPEHNAVDRTGSELRLGPLEECGVSTTTDGDVVECAEIETDLDPKAVGRRGPRLRLEILDDYGVPTTAETGAETSDAETRTFEPKFVD